LLFAFASYSGIGSLKQFVVAAMVSACLWFVLGPVSMGGLKGNSTNGIFGILRASDRFDFVLSSTRRISTN
jgi:hypothetical protein